MSAVAVVNLVKRFITCERRGFVRRSKKVVEALRGVSFEVRRGEVFGLLGPNGAGKTTTVKILSTLLLPDEGDAYVMGYSVTKDPVKVREIIGVTLSVERGFFWKLTGRENLMYFGMLRGLAGSELKRRVNEVLEVVGLNRLGASDKLFEEYSLGMKARLALARALLHNPPVLILDEPTIGLDPASARDIRKLLVKLAKEGRKTIIITTHNMFEAEAICDRIAIMNQGKVIACGTVHELKRRIGQRISLTIVIASTDVDIKRLEEILRNNVVSTLSVEQHEEGIRIRVVAYPEEEEKVLSRSINVLASLGVRVRYIRVEEPSLEDVFIALTRG